MIVSESISQLKDTSTFIYVTKKVKTAVTPAFGITWTDEEISGKIEHPDYGPNGPGTVYLLKELNPHVWNQIGKQKLTPTQKNTEGTFEFKNLSKETTGTGNFRILYKSDPSTSSTVIESCLVSLNMVKGEQVIEYSESNINSLNVMESEVYASVLKVGGGHSPQGIRKWMMYVVEGNQLLNAPGFAIENKVVHFDDPTNKWLSGSIPIDIKAYSEENDVWEYTFCVAQYATNFSPEFNNPRLVAGSTFKVEK